MNTVILMGRLTRDPEVRYSSGENQTAIARYTLAVDRRAKKEGGQDADFINCVAFGKGAEFTEKYFRQGMRVLVSGRIQTGSYTNREGQKVYTTDVIVDSQEFADSKKDSQGNQQGGYQPPQGGYNQPPQQNYNQPPQQNYSQPPQGGYNQPPQGGYNQPPQGGYNQPPQGGYNQPPQGGYSQPPQQNYNQPPQGSYGQPNGYNQPSSPDGFMNIPDNIDDDGLPFN